MFFVFLAETNVLKGSISRIADGCFARKKSKESVMAKAKEIPLVENTRACRSSWRAHEGTSHFSVMLIHSRLIGLKVLEEAFRGAYVRLFMRGSHSTLHTVLANTQDMDIGRSTNQNHQRSVSTSAPPTAEYPIHHVFPVHHRFPVETRKSKIVFFFDVHVDTRAIIRTQIVQVVRIAP